MENLSLVLWNDYFHKIKNQRSKEGRAYSSDFSATCYPELPFHLHVYTIQVKEMISDLANQMPVYNALKHKVSEHLECKICKCVPLSSATVVVTSCCNQYFGCKSCYERAVSSEVSCPLCRSTEVSAIPLKGFDGFFADLSSQH